MDLLQGVKQEASRRCNHVTAKPTPNRAGREGDCAAGEEEEELYITVQPGNRCSQGASRWTLLGVCFLPRGRQVARAATRHACLGSFD